MNRLLCSFFVLLLLLPAGISQAVNYEGPGLVQAPMITQTLDRVGVASFWNTTNEFYLDLVASDGWELRNVQIYVGNGDDQIPATKKGNLIPGRFPYKSEYANTPRNHRIVLRLVEDLDFAWGVPFTDLRDVTIAVHISAVKLNADGTPGDAEAAWAYTGTGTDTEIGEVDETSLDATEFEGMGKGWVCGYKLSHPIRGHLIDSPVGGLTFWTLTHSNLTDEAGAFDYFPGETVTFAIGNSVIGSAVADHKMSPLDFFAASDTEDHRVINMGRLLQSLDSDAYPKGGITITPKVVAAFETTMGNLGLESLDFSNDTQINAVIDGTIVEADSLGVYLDKVSADEAKAHLDETLSNIMFRKNISKTPELGSTKAKLATSTMWFPAWKANGEVAEIDYFDEDGILIRTATEAKPIIVTYTDDDPVTGAAETWAAVSRDDGTTWKRKNLSRSADRSSFALANGQPFYGAVKKPVVQFRGNKIIVAWSSKFCRGGKPAYSLEETTDAVPTPYYTDDIWGVGGPQRSFDYTEMGFPEVGELPFSSVWIARGVIATQADVDLGLGTFVGDIVWFKPERLTSGRRDALQIFMGGASGAGFALAWQEDPEGVRPGKFAGPGHGWSGATTNHKTDIWYSYISWADFAKVDLAFVSGGDPEHDVDAADAADPDDTSVGRPKALVPMSLPIRLTDNDVINTHNILVELGENDVPVQDEENGNYTPVSNEDALSEEGDGTHRYATVLPEIIAGWHTYINYQDESKTVAFTDDGRLLDGDTGASRVNLFLQPYVNADGKTSAWAIINYEETKGAGNGPPEDGTIPSEAYLPEQGKNAVYHSFDFKTPDLVSGGTIMNLPERDIYGNVLYLVDENGGQILDWQDKPILAYENARRARFILQGGGAIVPTVHRTSMVTVYKEGREGSGRPSDIMLRRFEVPVGADLTTHNPYCIENLVGTIAVSDGGQEYYADGAVNMSTVTPVVTTDSMGDPDQEDPYGAVKVVTWVQTLDNFQDLSYVNQYEDARAHRGQIRGDFVTMGFSYTPNWAAARNGNDKYDFHIRRSFDGGKTWTTDPAGSGVTHCRTSTDPTTKVKDEVCTTYAAGEFEEMRNLSQLPNAKTSVIEPRVVAVPGTIKDPETKNWTGLPEDKQNPAVYYVAYGTASNPKKEWDPITGEMTQEDGAPMDLFYSFTQDMGEIYSEDEWLVNPDSDGTSAGETVSGWAWLAKGDQEQGEVQIRMTPDGSRFYSCWLDEGEEGSDIVFRRIMPAEFPQNIAATAEETAFGLEEDATSSDDFTSDSGGDND